MMTVIDIIIALEKLPDDMRVLIDVPHGGEMFKFADVISVKHIEIDDVEGNPEQVVMITHFDYDLYEVN